MSQQTKDSESATLTKAEPQSRMEVPTLHQATVSDAALAPPGTPLPGFPVPSSPNDLPPSESEHIFVSQSADRLGLFFEAQNSSATGWVADAPGVALPGVPWTLVSYGPGYPPPDYTLTLRRFWRRKEYTHVPPRQSFTQQYELQYGISTTITETLSAELGVQVAGLSAKLSKTWQTADTVSTQTTTIATYSDTALPNTTDVWVLWQLVDELVALGPTGKPIDPYKASVTLTDPSPGNWDAWVYLNNPVTRLPYDIFVPHVTTFATP